MFITNHVLAGAAIGLLTRRPAGAFVAGAASHVLMDTCPHWGDPRIGWDDFVRVARVDGFVGLGVTAMVAAGAPRPLRAATLAGVAGACAIDMDKPGRLFLGRSPFPPPIDRFHHRIQREYPAGRRAEMLWGAALAAVLGAALRVARRPPSPRPSRSRRR